jgi:methylphosphotriester-DNA--protein-cysteine methyltransferase
LAIDDCEADSVDVDQLLLGTHPNHRRLDPRVEMALNSLSQDPTRRHTAAECARLTKLSSSRFLHLFKQEVGINFRRFRAWKRARALLYHVKRSASLTDIALDTGYPDSTHFSHSIRRTYGLTPRDILTGSRRLLVLLQSARSGQPPLGALAS